MRLCEFSHEKKFSTFVALKGSVMAKNLVIVESPAKAKTIEGFLGKDYIVKSSFGHVRDLPKSAIGVEIDKDFLPVYEIPADKKAIISELKKMSKSAETVWLATDEDREGEAISWHLAETLELPAEKCRRIVFHEITKNAILQAIEKPRQIDQHLVDAQQARRVLDRLVGFELSPLLWKKIKPALSAGRVQSVAVRLIVEREKEIQAFQTTSAFRVLALFDVKNGEQTLTVKAELPRRFSKRDDAQAFLESCIKAIFTVEDTETKPAKKSPAPPFTTSTLQQEASRKLGFSVAKTMSVAQKLYEAGKITYMRTDSVTISNMAMAMAKEAIERNFGKEYVNLRKFTSKTKGAQEAHEAIRPTYINVSEAGSDLSEKKLYDLIWKRTIASQMTDASLEKTTVSIGISSSDEKLIASGEVLRFDGFLKVYMESTDDEDEESTAGMLPPLKVGQVLPLLEMTASQRFSKNPPRYTEASLVKKLEELGIGRPSTFAPTISTIQKREYVVKENREGEKRQYEVFLLKNDNISTKQLNETTGAEKNKLFPTDIGIVVNNFLMAYFTGIMDYHFTASVEKQFDEVAQGQKPWTQVLNDFYWPFHQQVEDTLKNSDKHSGERLLGADPKSGRNVYVKIGRFGPMVQIGDPDESDKPVFAGLPKEKSLESVSLEEALELFRLPRQAGSFEGKEMTVAIGRFGPYVMHDKQFFSIPKEEDPLTLTEETAIAIIEDKRKRDKERVIREYSENPDIQVLKGRWGAYIAASGKNYKLPKGTTPETLSLEDCLEIISKVSPSKKTRAGSKKTSRKKTK
jgi:DNA topoisomerase I